MGDRTTNVSARGSARVDRATVSRAATELQLAGVPVCVHSSLRSFGHVEAGADAVVDGLLDVGATVLVPTQTFTLCRAPRPSSAPTIPFNAEDDGTIPPEGSDVAWGYDAAGNEVDHGMGAIPRAVLARPERHRGAHPLSSFAALGPHAEQLIREQSPERFEAPLMALAELRGVVICMGVDLTALTFLHLAEVAAGIPPLRRWGMLKDGRVVEAPHGGCSRGFEQLSPDARSAERQFTVGRSRWRIFDANTLLEAMTTRFRQDPGAGRCENECPRCRDRPLRALQALEPSGGGSRAPGIR